MNITEPIWRNCRAWPDRVAAIYDGKPVPYGAMGRTAELVSARMAAAGLRRGDCVALSLRSPLAYLIALMAAARIGAIATPIQARDADELKRTLIARHKVRALVHDHGEPWRSDAIPPTGYLDIQQLLAPAKAGEAVSTPLAADADDLPWVIALSSGTTGVPKSIPQTHVRGHLSLAMTTVPVGGQRVFVLTDMAISLGLASAMRTLVAGGTLVVTSLAEPAQIFALVERDKPTRMITTPALAAQLVAYAATHVPDSLRVWASLRSCMVSGAAAPPALRQGFVSRICPSLEINYGSTEAGGLAVANTETLAAHPDSAGRLNAWVQGEAVDEQDRPLPAGQSGLLRFKTPLMVSGYLEDEETTARMFRNGWFYPGDIGSIDAAGYVRLGGRVDNLLNLGGHKFDPAVVEQVLNAHPAVMESAVVGAAGPDSVKVVLVAVVVAHSPVDGPELRRHCRERLGAALTPAHVVLVPALPKNAAGKVMRAELVSRLRLPPAPR